MTQVEVDVKPTPPVLAVPREKRDWKGWRKKRMKMFFKKLPQMAPKFRKRFERGVDRFSTFTAKIKTNSAQITRTIDKVRQARRDRDRRMFSQSTRQLKGQINRFKKMVAGFRKGLNRVRVIGRTSHRVEEFVAKNRGRFSDQELAAIEPDLAVISQKRVQLRDVIRTTIGEIKRTFRDLRKLRQEIKRAQQRRK